ncbi:DUF1127 domain-containing protein [Salipiger sp. IMCC34102]|uniref:DUF1127 domain-containing protein n=1 Tax=Salipiger sp. IMCC34102 TaxID=2510647 RepID=UPI0013EA8DDE|nr:DUF1127 domain-containing protein [Salipiger sp. IMCC34102]
MAQIFTPDRISLLDAPAHLPKPAQLCLALAVTLTVWDLRRRTRKHLATCEGQALADVGLTAVEARAEAAKPFYRA